MDEARRIDIMERWAIGEITQAEAQDELERAAEGICSRGDCTFGNDGKCIRCQSHRDAL